MEQGRDDHRLVMPAAESGDIDRILALASTPQLPEGATDRLLARLARETEGNVELFRPRPRSTGSVFRYAAALPLAASLALGVYLGAQGALDSFLPATLTGDVITTGLEDGFDDLGGVGEADAYAEENLT